MLLCSGGGDFPRIIVIDSFYTKSTNISPERPIKVDVYSLTTTLCTWEQS